MKTLLFACVISFLTFPVVADAEVGSISTLDGPVQIDAFGTGDFIEAVPGEVLYERSIVRTGPQATAVLEVDELRTELPPSSELHVASLRTAREKKSRSGWLGSVAGAVKAAWKVIYGEKTETKAGGRAADAGQSDTSGWVVEDEDSESFNSAIAHIENGEFGDAVAKLKEITDPLPGTFLPGEVAFWLGHSQYQLENYDAAIEAFQDSLVDIDSKRIQPTTLKYYEDLLFQSGASYYMQGNLDQAAYHMERLAPFVSERYAGYTYLILIDTLTQIGDNTKAKLYLSYADDKLRGIGLDAEFDALGAALR